jgi:hypothetical protein
MIEIKITIDVAMTLFFERMKFELLICQRLGIINPGLKFENLSYDEVFEIMEASVFDTVLSLPVDLLASETNLMQIITQTVHSLDKVLSWEEFQLYSTLQAAKLITSVCSYIKAILKSNNYKNN